MSAVANLYEHLPAKYRKAQGTYASYPELQISLPNRIIIVAPSGAGKTNLALNTIIKINAFTKVHIFAKCLDEPLWEWFIDSIHEVEEKMTKKLRRPVKILEVVTTELANLPSVDEFDRNETNLVIFDDQVTETSKSALKNMTDLWIRGRKQNITTMYLTQNYYAMDKTMRRNNGILILKALGTAKDKRAILSEVAEDKSVEELTEMFKQCDTHELGNFFMIDTSAGGRKELRYRKNFTPFPQ